MILARIRIVGATCAVLTEAGQNSVDLPHHFRLAGPASTPGGCGRCEADTNRGERSPLRAGASVSVPSEVPGGLDHFAIHCLARRGTTSSIGRSGGSCCASGASEGPHDRNILTKTAVQSIRRRTAADVGCTEKRSNYTPEAVRRHRPDVFGRLSAKARTSFPSGLPCSDIV